MADEISKQKRRLQNKESQRRFRQRRHYHQNSSSVQLVEEPSAKPDSGTNPWLPESAWPSSMPSTAFFQTHGEFQNERRSSSSTAQNDGSGIPPVHMPQSSPRITQTWGIPPGPGVVGSVPSPSQSAPQQYPSQFSQQSDMSASQAPVLQGLPVIDEGPHNEAHAIPIANLGEQREPSVSSAQPLLPPFNARNIGGTGRSPASAGNQYPRSNGTNGNARERSRRYFKEGCFSRAEEMVLDVERLYEVSIDLGILEEDNGMLASLRDMRSRFRDITRRATSDDEDDLITQEFDMDVN